MSTEMNRENKLPDDVLRISRKEYRHAFIDYLFWTIAYTIIPILIMFFSWEQNSVSFVLGGVLLLIMAVVLFIHKGIRMIKLYMRRFNDFNIEGELAVVAPIILSFFAFVFYANAIKLRMSTFAGKGYFVGTIGLLLLILVLGICPLMIKGNPDKNKFGPAPQD